MQAYKIPKTKPTKVEQFGDLQYRAWQASAAMLSLGKLDHHTLIRKITDDFCDRDLWFTSIFCNAIGNVYGGSVFD